MSDFTAIVEILDAKKVGGTWMARCPAHDDRKPSLAITRREGKVLLHCHADCPQRDIIAALTDLGVWKPQADSQPSKRIIAEYNYSDERGELLYQVLRYNTIPKTFAHRHPNGPGNWIWKKHPRQVLYHLPEVLEASIIFLPEGEKDVESLRARGFTATCEAGGANAPWLDSFTQTLAGRVFRFNKHTVVARSGHRSED